MKKRYYTIVAALTLCATMMSSCGNDFLRLKPESNYTDDTFYTTADEFKSALSGCYHMVQEYYQVNYFIFNEFRSDNVQHATVKYSDENIILPDDTKTYWLQLWKSIYTINKMLYQLKDFKDITPELKNDITCQARFLRAYTYFVLVRTFGGVGIITEPVTPLQGLKVQRQTAEKTYDFIISELNDLITVGKLPRGYKDCATPSEVTAYAMLTQIYVMRCGYPYYTSEWDKVRDYSKLVIDSGLFEDAFAPQWPWTKIFSNEGETSPEFIFSIRYKSGGISEECGYNRLNCGLYTGSGRMRHEPEFYKSFELAPDATTNIRREASLALKRINIVSGLEEKFDHVIKFAWDYDAANDQWGNDLPVIRYTDIKLLYAEAICKLSGNVEQDAIDILNQVRQRAELPDLTTVEINSMAEWQRRLLAERRSEFVGEGIRWYDLVRTKTYYAALMTANPTKAANFDDNSYIFPLPQSEVDKVNNPKLMWQNPGYFGY